VTGGSPMAFPHTRHPEHDLPLPPEPDDSFEIVPSASGAGDKRVNGMCPNDEGRFIIHRKLGSGAFAQIWEATDRTTKEHVAIKDIGLAPEFATELENEFAIIAKINHDNVIRVVHKFAQGVTDCIVFELAEGDLFERLEDDTNPVSETDCRSYTEDICSALQHVHSLEIVHCDVKLENMLIVRGRVKLCDFGLAGFNGTQRRGIPYGTKEYMAPELLTGMSKASLYKITAAQDVWSFAIVLYAVLFADLPWSTAYLGDPDFANYAENGIADHMAPWCLLSLPMRDLMRQLLSVSPHRRPTFHQVADFFASKTPWLSDEEVEEDVV